MPLTKEKRKLNKLIEESDSDESEHELAYYVNDRIKLMKEVLKVVKPKKIKAMAPACLKNLEIEEINSMLLEELLGISNKRLKYIFNGQDLEEDSSTTSEDEPMDVISLDDISDEELVINIDDDKEENEKKPKKRVKHNKSKKERKKSLKEEDLVETYAPEIDLDSKKNLMSVLELLELQARARAIKSQLLLENAKVQESVALSKIPTMEEKVGSDDEIIIKTTKTEEIVITSSDDEEISRVKKLDSELVQEKEIKSSESSTVLNDDTVLNNVEENNSEPTQNSDNLLINIIENKELSTEKVPYVKDVSQNDTGDEKIIGDTNMTNITRNVQAIDNSKSCDNDGIIQINLSDDEIDSMK